MYVSGKIPINSKPLYSEIIALSTRSGISAIVEGSHIKLIIKEISFSKDILIKLSITNSSIAYRCFFSELSAYIFLCVIALFLLYGMLSIKVWLFLLTGIIIALFLVKIYFDKRIRKTVEIIIPQSVRLIPEMAGKEHIEWINNPLICSACGTPINKYSKKCLSCGITLSNQTNMISNTNHTGYTNNEIKYFYKE